MTARLQFLVQDIKVSLEYVDFYTKESLILDTRVRISATQLTLLHITSWSLSKTSIYLPGTILSIRRSLTYAPKSLCPKRLRMRCTITNRVPWKCKEKVLKFEGKKSLIICKMDPGSAVLLHILQTKLFRLIAKTLKVKVISLRKWWITKVH